MIELQIARHHAAAGQVVGGNGLDPVVSMPTEGKTVFLEKRAPDFGKFTRYP